MKTGRLWHVLVWLSRCNHSRGFGIQSPTDYHFVRTVINESWPYYAYETLAPHDSWLQHKLGRLCFRLANHLQPAIVYDATNVMSQYVQAGCHRASIHGKLPPHPVDMAILPCDNSYEPLLPMLHDQSMVVYMHIQDNPQQWHRLLADGTFNVFFDLYYCGIAIIDNKRSANHYIVNF